MTMYVMTVFLVRLWEKGYISFTLLHLRPQCNSTMLHIQAWIDRSKIPFHHL